MRPEDLNLFLQALLPSDDLRHKFFVDPIIYWSPRALNWVAVILGIAFVRLPYRKTKLNP